MTMYARVADGRVEATFDLTQEQYDQLVANGKATHLRLWIVDPQPVITATQVLQPGPVVITETEAHQTWTVREKTQMELDREANATETATLRQMISAVTVDIDAFNANPDVTGTAVERLTKLEARVKDLERQQRRDNRILRYYLRSLVA